MGDSSNYQYSSATDHKQDGFRAVVDLNMKLITHILRKRTNTLRPVYIDLNAGPGLDGNLHMGSPLLFAYLSRKNGLRYTAHFYEKSPEEYQSLCENFTSSKLLNSDFTIHNCDHAQVVDILPQATEQYRYGLVYSDPSNAVIPTDILCQINTKWPRVDILINVAAASLKRNCYRNDYRNLEAQLEPIGKKNWLVRKPKFKHQWAMLVLTGWKDYPPSQGFYNIQDPRGKEILNEIVFTKNERFHQIQPPLLGDDDNGN